MGLLYLPGEGWVDGPDGAYDLPSEYLANAQNYFLCARVIDYPVTHSSQLGPLPLHTPPRSR